MTHFPLDWQHALAFYILCWSLIAQARLMTETRVAQRVACTPPALAFLPAFLYFVGFHAPGWWPL